MSEQMSNEAWRVLMEHRMTRIEEAVVGISNNLEAITRLQIESENRNLAVLELKSELASVKKTVADINTELPTLKATRKGAARLLDIVGTALVVGVLALLGLKLK